MPSENNNANQILINGEEVINLRSDTVSSENLLQGETAHNKAGEQITGDLDPATKDDAYLVSDIEDDIADDDYIPFNDVSDPDIIKKKTLFSSIVTKIKTAFNSVFASITGNNITEKKTFRENIQTIEFLGVDIPDNADLDTYTTAGNYRVVSDASGATITNLPLELCGKVIVFNNGNGGIEQFYFANHSPRIFVRTKFGTDAWSTWKELGEGGDNKAHTYELGTEIPTNSDFNDYKTIGVYFVKFDSIASNISNMPEEKAGKLIVSQTTSANDYFIQTFYSNATTRIYERYYLPSQDTWSAWNQLASTDDISPSTVGNGYAVATVSGSAISATITGFQLRAGVIVAIKTGGLPINATLNINSTGAKSIKWMNENIKEGDTVRLINSSQIFTFIYDGTNYHIISYSELPSMSLDNYVANTSGNINLNWGYSSDRAQIKYNIGDNRLKWDYYKNSAWHGDVALADYEDLGVSLTKVGKSILPSWSYTSNTLISSGITYTFNPTTGEITANGTASALSTCVLAGVNYSYYCLPKGTYRLSGCASGGSDSKYRVTLDLNGYSLHDYGSGNTFTLSTTHKSINNEHFYIVIFSGQTVSNLVFKPMLCPAWATADFEPCEDIHKGNCYVGTCTTAGATKDKEAYVDGYFVLRKGVRVAIKFTNTNTYSNATASPITLNVNNTGAKNIWYWSTHSGAGNTGTNATIYGSANRYVTYYYDGTYWIWDGMSGESNDNQRKSFYGTCSTEASAQVKVVTLADTTGWELRAGTIVGVKFTNSNTFNATADAKCQLNVNNTGAKNIYYNTGYPTGSSGTIFGVANRIIYYMYNGTDWCWINHGLDVDTVDPRVLGFGYGTCDTAEATTAKVVTLASYTLRNGGYVSVKFTYSVPANATMNINSRGAKNIWYRGANITANIIRAGDLATFIYDGTRYQLVANDRWGVSS